MNCVVSSFILVNVVSKSHLSALMFFLKEVTQTEVQLRLAFFHPKIILSLLHLLSNVSSPDVVFSQYYVFHCCLIILVINLRIKCWVGMFSNGDYQTRLELKEN